MRKFKRFLKKILTLLIVIIFISIISCQYLKGRDNINSQERYDGPYKVVKVVDGDTIILNINNVDERVRLIGIDTPESVHPDKSKNSSDGEAASNFTKNILNNKLVYIEYDKSTRDKYNRILAYIYIQENNKLIFVNDFIISNGYAYPVTIEPNDKYADQFLQSFEYARNNQLGLWAEK